MKAFKNKKILRTLNDLGREENYWCEWRETFQCEHNQLIWEITEMDGVSDFILIAFPCAFYWPELSADSGSCLGVDLAFPGESHSLGCSAPLKHNVSQIGCIISFIGSASFPLPLHLCSGFEGTWFWQREIEKWRLAFIELAWKPIKHYPI